MYYQRLSTVGERAIAFIIDHFIFTFMFAIVMLLSYTVSEIFIIIMFIIPILYLFKDIKDGQSIGKGLMKIGIRDSMNIENNVSISRLFLRNIFLFVALIEFIVLLFSTKGERLGDQVAKTRVVKLGKKTENYSYNLEQYYNNSQTIKNINVFKALGIFGGIIIAFVLAIFIITFTMLKSSGAYEASINEIEQSIEISEEIGDIKGYGIVPTGSISITNGYGEARLSIKVKGEQKNIFVTCYSIKEPGESWEVKECKIRP